MSRIVPSPLNTFEFMFFITGASGLLGSHILLGLLKNGAEVKALKRTHTNLSSLQNLFKRNNQENLLEKVIWVEGEINNPLLLEEEIKSCKYVIHCAATVSFDARDNDTMYTANVIGTKNLVNACLANKIEKLIYISSTAAIGKQKANLIINEELYWDEGMKNSFYSYSKYLAELEVWRGTEEGLIVGILNPAVIIGPGEWGKSSTNLFPTSWNGLSFYTSGSNAFVDVRDVAKAAILFVTHPIKNERFLIFSENMSFKNLFTLIADSLGKTPPKYKANRVMSSIAWRLLWVWSKISGARASITREAAKSANSKQVYSNEKFVKAFDFKFVPIKTSIKETSEIFLAEIKPN